MPTFIDVHEGFHGITEPEFAAAHQADVAIQAEEGVTYERAWLDSESGKAFCLITGPSKEAVMRVHERAGHPTPQVFEMTAQV